MRRPGNIILEKTQRTGDCAGFSAVKLWELTPFCFCSHIPVKFSFYFNSQINLSSGKVMQRSSSLKASAGRNNEEDITEALFFLPSILSSITA